MYNTHIAADCAQSSYHLSLTSNNNMFIFELVSTSLLLLTRITILNNFIYRFYLTIKKYTFWEDQ